MSESDSDSEYSGSEQDSDSETSEDDDVKEEDPKPTAKRKGKQRTTIPTCKFCKREFPDYTGKKLKNHQNTCVKRNPLNKCMWCGLQFTNRGNLATHAFHIHGDSSYKSTNKPLSNIVCEVCNKRCPTYGQLRFHVRKIHFNLKAKIPHAEVKKVNQIWIEKVNNSNKIVEIKKTGHSCLLLRTLDENTGLKVKEVEQKTVDLSSLYPLQGKNAKGKCEHCGIVFLKRDIRKHIDEKHNNIRKFSCNNCNRSFKRSYQYLQHQCHRPQKKAGVKHVNGRHSTGIKIANVESLGSTKL